MTERPGVSFVVPVHNGRRWLPDVIEAIQLQRDGRPFEIIVVDDGSTDGSSRWLRKMADESIVTRVAGPERGAAAAVNAGIREARYPIICQVDQDVIVARGWLAELDAAMQNVEVAAAQGHYMAAHDAGFWARIMSRDLECRYARMRGPATDHVCTGNTAYRASALHAVGLLDETLGYGYDNDLSYRLSAAGYRLVFCAGARSAHRWREGLTGYLRQQFGFGYGRLDVVWKHPRRARGDTVSDAAMMAHGPLTLGAALLIALSGLLVVAGVNAPAFTFVGIGVLTLLAAERMGVGLATWKRTGDRTAFAFPIAHLLRDAAWSAAIVLWCLRRIAGRSGLPAHSMRPAGRISLFQCEASCQLENRDLMPGILAVVPAYNEVDNLRRVVGELRRVAPSIDVLVVNDGSTDATPEMLPHLGVNWLTMPARVGVGGAVRAGLRYAVAHGYGSVVRIDGDGQHRASDIARLVRPVAAGHLDAVIGSRFMSRRSHRPTLLRAAQALLAVCLSAATKRRITDATSGFCVFGPRALRLLARHHPTGYAEPELILLLHRYALRVGEIPIRIRKRRKGRTSLTPVRTMVALGRTLLALFIVPTRRTVADWSGQS